MKFILADGTEYTITNFDFDSEHATFRLENRPNFTDIYEKLTAENLAGATFYDDKGNIITSGNYVYETCRAELAGAGKGVHIQIILGMYQEPREVALERELTETQMALVEMYETLLTMRVKLEE